MQCLVSPSDVATMSRCLVLGDNVVEDILLNLSKDDILKVLRQVEESLIGFSVSDERKYQPEASIINRPDGRRNLFRPFTSSTGVGVKIVVDPSQALKSDGSLSVAEHNKLKGLHGILALCDNNGFPTGFVNAEAVTGYRTSLSAIMLWSRRQKTTNIVIFGAGKQALWHIRLCLSLRGDEINRITVINRNQERSESLVEQLKEENQFRWKSNVELKVGSNATMEQAVSEADAVFCTTPSQEVLLPGSYVSGDAHYVSAIGSWQANMIELDPEFVKSAASGNDERSIVVVDDRQSCLNHTGEFLNNNIQPDQVYEVGEVLASKDNNLKQKLEQGKVIYKSVGVSVTDLAAGQAILELAKAQGKGIVVPDF